MSSIQTTRTWTVEGKEGFDSLKFHDQAPLPNVGDNDVLVKFHAASLNYRDLIIPMVRQGRSLINSYNQRIRDEIAKSKTSSLRIDN
jgi:NADPH:quinone reductase-like Zn-dependent oxidoreductase